jgi:hypothetical protein
MAQAFGEEDVKVGEVSAGPDGWCSPRHHTRFVPSCIELLTSYDVASHVHQTLGVGQSARDGGWHGGPGRGVANARGRRGGDELQGGVRAATGARQWSDGSTAWRKLPANHPMHVEPPFLELNRSLNL